MAPREVTVVGAGVIGLVTAVTLAEAGFAVRVFERAAGFGGHAASWVAGGMLAPGCERVGTSPQVAVWGQAALAWWRAHVSDTQTLGSLVVAPARDDRELTHFARRTDGYRWLDGAALATLEPLLAGRFARALHFPGEAHLDPRIALLALAARIEDLGGEMRFGADGHDISKMAGMVVDCRGLAARDRLSDLRAVRGEMVLVRCPEVTLSRPVRLLHPRIPLYVVPRSKGLFMIGATMIESEQGGGVSLRSLVELLSSAYALHPAFGEAEVVEVATGLRPSFPDNLPAVRRMDTGLAVNGAYRHGFLSSPYLSKIVLNELKKQQL